MVNARDAPHTYPVYKGTIIRHRRKGSSVSTKRERERGGEGGRERGREREREREIEREKALQSSELKLGQLYIV